MPQATWSQKRERQYEHIKEGLEARGRTEELAEEIAARTVNKERARAGEARTASPDFHLRPLLWTPGRPSIAPRPWGSHVSPALCRGATKGREGSIGNGQGRFGERGGWRLRALGRGPR